MYPSPHPARAVMAQRRMTIRALAAEVGVNANTLGRVLNGRADPWPALRKKVALALGMPETALFHDPEDLAVERLAHSRLSQGLSPDRFTDAQALSAISEIVARTAKARAS